MELGELDQEWGGHVRAVWGMLTLSLALAEIAKSLHGAASLLGGNVGAIALRDEESSCIGWLVSLQVTETTRKGRLTVSPGHLRSASSAIDRESFAFLHGANRNIFLLPNC